MVDCFVTVKSNYMLIPFCIVTGITCNFGPSPNTNISTIVNLDYDTTLQVQCKEGYYLNIVQTEFPFLMSYRTQCQLDGTMSRDDQCIGEELSYPLSNTMHELY